MLKLVDSVNLFWYYISSTFFHKIKNDFQSHGKLTFFKTTKIDFKSTFYHVAQDLRSKNKVTGSASKIQKFFLSLFDARSI